MWQQLFHLNNDLKHPVKMFLMEKIVLLINYEVCILHIKGETIHSKMKSKLDQSWFKYLEFQTEDEPRRR